MAEKEGFFKEAGLEVAINSPSDPSAPLKEVAAGRADLAITYEPEVMLAHEKGLDVVAVAALVNRPLTSLMWLKRNRRDQRRRRPERQNGLLRRDPLPGSLPEDDPAARQRAGLHGEAGERRLRPDALAGQRLGPGDARRLLERRGRRPAAARQRTGDHPGRPARRADLRRARHRRPPLHPGRRGRTDPPLHRRPAARHRSGGGEPESGDRSDPRRQHRPRTETRRSPGESDAAAARAPAPRASPTARWTRRVGSVRGLDARRRTDRGLPKAAELLSNAYLVDEIPE